MVFIAYTDEDGGEAQPFAGHVEALKSEFVRAELVLKDGWLVTSGGWRNYFCDDRACCPVRALAEIGDSALNAELIFAGSNPQTHENAADPAFTGAVDNGAKIAALAEEWNAPEPFDFTGVFMGQARTEWAAAAGATVDEGTACVLVSYLQHKGIRDRVMADMINTDDDPQVYRAVLIGDHRGRPDWVRVDQFVALLIDLLAFTPDRYRAALFTALGYLNWYKGRGTTAARYIDKALEACEGYQLAGLMKQLFNSGILPAVTRSAADGYRNPGH